jgi:hypothetical protein
VTQYTRKAPFQYIPQGATRHPDAGVDDKQRLLDSGYSLHIVLEPKEACVIVSKGNTVAVMPQRAPTEAQALRAAIAAVDEMNGLMTYGNAVDD